MKTKRRIKGSRSASATDMDGRTTSRSVDRSDAFPTTLVTPDMITAALRELEALAQATLKSTGVPGAAIAVVHRDRMVYAKGFGLRELGKPERVDAETVFQLASLSKPLSSTVIAGLVSDKVVTWDDRLIDHDPDFRMYDPFVAAMLTIRDMFSHRSGLSEHAGDLLEDMDYDRTEILRRLRYMPTENRFRSHYAYTNFGLTAASVAAAHAAGRPWEDLSAQRLYKQLGMRSTSSRLSDFLAHTNRARGHMCLDGRWTAKYQRKPDAQSPAGGASSNVNDMARWMRLHLNRGIFNGGPIIAAAALAETYHPHMVNHPETQPAEARDGFYGLGWNVNYDERGRVTLGHSGAFALGAATTVTLLPTETLGIVVLTNGQPIGVPEALVRSFVDLVTYGTAQQDWLTLFRPVFEEMAKEGRSPIDYADALPSPLPALANTAYAGKYVNTLYGLLDICVRGGRLTMRQGLKKIAFPLRHYNHNTFYYDTTGESAVGLSGVTFTIDATGIATHVTVENLDRDGLGMFTRSSATQRMEGL